VGGWVCVWCLEGLMWARGKNINNDGEGSDRTAPGRNEEYIDVKNGLQTSFLQTLFSSFLSPRRRRARILF